MPIPNRALPWARKTAAVSTAGLLVLGMAACGADDEGGAEDGDALTVSDPWVKATDGEMVAAFGEIVNDTGSDVHITGASSEVAGMVELHETVDENGQSVMRPMADGIELAAGETFALEPGGAHIMLMDLGEELQAGDDVVVTLDLEDGSELEFTAPVKDFAGADEEYQSGSGN
ncbi:copper chaperone PCu(A)C [Salininema proteolyticum]|uniref:Copper chaperone PCu(A)C n=1 Tax=Salininema proteolyticum TaxID=1607685 RepID=A0ABV8TYW1_9ACTN